jgi:hypothetical protein
MPNMCKWRRLGNGAHPRSSENIQVRALVGAMSDSNSMATDKEQGQPGVRQPGRSWWRTE